MGELNRAVFTDEKVGGNPQRTACVRVSAITYTPAFKLAAVKTYAEDQTLSC